MSHITHFPGQQPEEKILHVMHRHWYSFAREVIGLAVVGILPALIVWALRSFAGWELAEGSMSRTLLAIGGTLFYLFLWILFFGFWLDFYLDFYIITDKRLVDIEQSGLFSRTVSEQPLYRIQDVTSETHGVTATVMRYGNVYIQTAGTKERFVFEDVPHPEQVVRIILGLTEVAQKAASQPAPGSAPTQP